MASRGQVRAPHLGSGPPGGRLVTVTVRLRETGETFCGVRCSPLWTVGEVKDRLELLAGIPRPLQTLSYLDEGDMPDSSTLKYNAVIPGGTLSMSVWQYDGLTDLVTCAAKGDLAKLIGVGVTPDSTYNTENSLRLDAKQKKDWLATRAGIALYIAAHRGHLHIVRFLSRIGHNVQYNTQLGNTPLHVAAAMGQNDCLQELLNNRAETQITNRRGQTALDMARTWGQVRSEQKLFLFQWEERAANVTVQTHLESSELFAHQKFDSKQKTWFNGSYAKKYMANLTQEQDFFGTHISAPPKKTPVRKIVNQTKDI
ncbi:ankyrin repeat domain-containing protein 60 [Anomaloglossus baeobatrachus]|uniref:ankyrin repeat domain-containing protein 60 n=1 Tax=Anomaloglossus baeobatrachus TaxID=238106 RepID=UPI003F4F4A22